MENQCLKNIYIQCNRLKHAFSTHKRSPTRPGGVKRRWVLLGVRLEGARRKRRSRVTDVKRGKRGAKGAANGNRRRRRRAQVGVNRRRAASAKSRIVIFEKDGQPLMPEKGDEDDDGNVVNGWGSGLKEVSWKGLQGYGSESGVERVAEMV